MKNLMFVVLCATLLAIGSIAAACSDDGDSAPAVTDATDTPEDSGVAEGDAPTELDFGRATSVNEERIAEGRDLYQQVECWQCHGQEGRGDGGSAATLEDDGGMPIFARDLTRGWYFNGGATVEDVYRRLRTGLDGTPMPTFSDLIDSGSSVALGMVESRTRIGITGMSRSRAISSSARTQSLESSA